MGMETEKKKEFAAAEAGIPTSQLGYQLRSFTEHRLKRGALLYWAALFTMGAAIMHFMGALKQLPPSGLLAFLLVGFTLIQPIIAIAVVAVPARRLLLAAMLVEAVGLLVWIVAHAFGLPDG